MELELVLLTYSEESALQEQQLMSSARSGSVPQAGIQGLGF